MAYCLMQRLKGVSMIIEARFRDSGELASVYYAESAIAIDDELEMEMNRNIYSRKRHCLKDIHLYELSFKNGSV